MAYPCFLHGPYDWNDLYFFRLCKVVSNKMVCCNVYASKLCALACDVDGNFEMFWIIELWMVYFGLIACKFSCLRWWRAILSSLHKTQNWNILHGVILNFQPIMTGQKNMKKSIFKVLFSAIIRYEFIVEYNHAIRTENSKI